jgi:hypothetical protein
MPQGCRNLVPNVRDSESCYRAFRAVSTQFGFAAAALALSMLATGAIAASDARTAASALPAGALAESPSLYLRESSHSPIRWQPWGEGALKLARKLDRPILLDIGAIWCHWCHVLDSTTYADPRVAELLNRFYVPVKLDADQRPDVDAFFQSAARRFGAGGWPLTVFADSDGRPLFIAGYLPPDPLPAGRRALGMVTILDRVRERYANDPKFRSGAGAAATEITEAPTPANNLGVGAALNVILAGLSRTYDHRSGGFGGASGPRFFDFPLIELALAHGFFGGPDFTEIALESLRKMAHGGVFDQLGGGFHRYATDARWGVPHFEKMLYDQAMALHAYSLAYAASGDQQFAHTARAIVGYIDSTLLDRSSGAFYSHQDADSFPGDDGTYYTWTAAEIREALAPTEGRAAMLHFGVEKDPALAPDGRVVLRRAVDANEIARQLRVAPADASRLVERASSKLAAARARRRAPRVDHAVMTDRNALMAVAYFAAADALGDPRLRKTALAAVDYLRAHLRAPDGGFYHVFASGKADVAGLAADQAYMFGALIDAYSATGSAAYLDDARQLADIILSRYRDPATGLLVNRAPLVTGTALEKVALVRQVVFDQPMPSPQGATVLALQKLGAITSEQRYAKAAVALLDAGVRYAPSGSAFGLGAIGLALEIREHGDAMIAVVGNSSDPRTTSLAASARRSYRPGKVVLEIDSAKPHANALPEVARAMFDATRDRSAPLAFVCAGTACANPVATPDRLTSLIRTFGVASALPPPVAKK